MIPVRRSRIAGGRSRSRSEPEAPPRAEPITPRERIVAEAVERWHTGLSELSGGSGLWDVRSLGDALVDLSSAHPSGIAQLFAGRPTRLSNLIREGSALAQARRRIRVVSARTDELAQRYGVAPTYVAVGVATWRTRMGTAADTAVAPSAPSPASGSAPAGTAAATAGASSSAPAQEADPNAPMQRSGPHDVTRAFPTEKVATRVVRAPVLLRPVRLGVHGSESEIDLELDPAVELNPVLVRDLQEHGVALDPGAIAAATMTPHGFSPQTALDEVAALGGALEEFQLERRIVLGAFVHPGQSLAEDLEALQDRVPRHDLIAALAGEPGAREKLASQSLPEPVGPDRPPAQEPGVGDLDRSQHHVLDAVATGAHLLIDAPPGVDVPGTVAAMLAQAVTAGQKVAYVPGSRRAAHGLMDRLRSLGLADLALDLCGDPTWRRSSVLRVVDGLNPAEPEVDAERLATDRAELVRVRRTLDRFVEALHQRREPWKASVHEALQSLAALTSQRPGPRTQVRLDGPVVTLDEDGRVRAREALARAAALGAFRLRAADTPWFGAELTSAEHALSTLEQVRSLSELMPTLLEQVEATSAQTGLDQATTFTQWGDQLRLLEGIRASLDIFNSHVFERSAKDMAAATATRAWRAERDVDLGWAERRRLRRQAKDLVRPGVSVPNLHEELVQVERRRDQWRKHCSGGAWPHLPQGLREITETHRRVQGLLEDLGGVLAPTVGGQDLSEIPLADLATRMERLGADDDSVRQMPERAAALSVLNAMGLAPLVQDLTTRRIPTAMVGAEFELAWWSSVLEEMLAADPALSDMDADTLAQMTEELRRLDSAHIDSLTAPVLSALRRRVRAAIEADRPRAQEFYRAAHSGLADLKEMLARFGDVAWEPRPVWLVPPMVVPTVLGPADQVDLLVLDAVQHLPAEHAIPAIARAKQVVVVGDTRRAGTGLVQQVSWLPRLTLSGDLVDQEPEIAAFLAGHGYEGLVRPIPAPPRQAPIRLEVVDGSGMPTPDSQVVESVQAEVDRAVDQVIDHALTRPEESLAVIAMNTRHADRVREAVLNAAQGSRTLERFFDAAAAEAFTVVEIEAAAGLRRDAVILSLGFGKTPHGRVLHRFGAVSGSDGAAYLIDALDAARHRLSVISCFRAGELDPERLRNPGSQMLREVLQFAEDGAAPAGEEDGEHVADPLLSDLTDRLRRRGLRVVPRYGRAGGVRIPLAVGHPALPGELVLAVLTDDDAYVAEPSLRLRERHWVQRLQNRGWHVRMVYSPAVFMDPQTVADQIAAQVSDIVTERRGGRAPTTPAVPPRTVVDDDDPLVTTNATLSALRGEQIAGAREAPLMDAVAPIAGERSARPDIEPGRPLGDYGDNELDALLAWIGSDNRPRTAAQLRTELAQALGLRRRGKHATAVLGHVVARSGLALAEGEFEPESAAGTDAGTAAGTEADAGTAADTEAESASDAGTEPDAAHQQAQPTQEQDAAPETAAAAAGPVDAGAPVPTDQMPLSGSDSATAAGTNSGTGAGEDSAQGTLDLGPQPTRRADLRHAPGRRRRSTRRNGSSEPQAGSSAGAEVTGNTRSEQGKRPDRPVWSPVMPDRAREDDPRAWGERGEDDDERILTERPPHWQ
ncbi:hypothetical protein [Pseudactinotalea sp. Z1748]|uniref:hypothetical protein n=1 Tax=Pseudactinotalea sp. Z1748 TaxID=3413027 RepID=UPI003C7BF672